MKCVICKDGTTVDGYVTVTLERENSLVIIKNVPASICNNCGDYTLSEKVTREVMLQAEKAVQNRAEVEILQYAA